MGSEYVSVGEIKIIGKAAKINMGSVDGLEHFFCFVSDLKSLLDGKFHFVRIYKDNL